MAAGTSGTNTMAEGLRKLLGQITDLKLTPDADLPFLINLETQVIHQINQGVEGAFKNNGGGMPGGPGGMSGGPAGLMGTPSPPPGMGSPQMVPGLQQGPAGPNPDELRRVLAQR